MRTVAVVVVTYHSEGDIAGFLDSVEAAILKANDAVLEPLSVRITVVDNASSDRTVTLAREHPLHPTVLETGDNLGYAAAINAATSRLPRDALVLVSNPDIRLRPDFLPPLLTAALEPDVGVIATKLIDSSGALLPSQRREPRVRYALAEALLGGRRASRLGLGEVVTDPRQYDQPRDVDWATGACLAITPEARRRVESWDESYFLYSEETDYQLRMHDAGLRVRYEPAAVAFHRGGASHTDPRLWQILTCNRVRLFRRRHGPIHSTVFWAATVLNEALRAWRAPTHRQALRALVRQRQELLKL